MKQFFNKEKNVKIFIFLIAIIYFLSLTSNLYLYEDNANYIILAKSLSTGQGYTRIHHLDNVPHLKFPPVLPLLLTPFYLLFGMNFLALKIVPLITGIFSFYLIYLLFKRESTPKIAFITMMLTAFNPFIFIFSHSIMTEIPYLFFSLLVLLTFTKYKKEKKKFGFYFFLLTSLLVISIFTRPMGISLLVAIGFYYFIDSCYSKKFICNIKKIIYLMIIPFIFIISWVFRGLVLAKDYVVDQHLGIGAYKSTFFLKDFLDPALGSMNLGEFITRFFVNVYQYSGAILLNDFQKIGLHSFSFFIPLVILLGTIFWIFVTIGFIKKFNKKSLLPFYILTYLFVILIDAWVTIRYLIPIIPFLIYYFVCGLQISIKKIFPKPLSKKMFLSIIMLITILSALGCVTEIVRQQREPYYQNEWYDFYQMSVWIEDNIQEGVFTSKKCATFYVWTNKKCSYHPLTADQSIMLNFLKIDRIDYIIVDNFSYNTAQRYLQPMIEKNKEHFQLIHQIGQTKLYKVKNKGS